MKWGTFFNWRKIKTGGAVATVSTVAGTAASLSLASNAENFCSGVVNSFINQMIRNVTIPELSTIVHYMQYNATVTLEDTTVIVPPTWVHMVNETPGVDPLCYKTVFLLGMSFTVCFSLALGAFINSVIVDKASAPRSIELEGPNENAIEAGNAYEHEPLLAGP